MAKKVLALAFVTLCWQSRGLAQCSNTSYGSGVTCIQGAGNGGAITNESAMTVSFSHPWARCHSGGLPMLG